MRKGVVQHAQDIILGGLVLLFGFILFHFLTIGGSPIALDDLAFKDSFDRVLVTYLQAPVGSLPPLEEPVDHYGAYAQNNYTLGDLVFLSTLDQKHASLYTQVVSASLQQGLKQFYFMENQPFYSWELNFTSSSGDMLLVDSFPWQQGAQQMSQAGFSNLSVIFPLEDKPLLLYLRWQQGMVGYFS